MEWLNLLADDSDTSMMGVQERFAINPFLKPYLKIRSENSGLNAHFGLLHILSGPWFAPFWKA